MAVAQEIGPQEQDEGTFNGGETTIDIGLEHYLGKHKKAEEEMEDEQHVQFMREARERERSAPEEGSTP